MSFFFDTYAIIELLKGNPNYEFVKDSTITTSTMNLAEFYYSLLLEKGKGIADSILNELNFELIEITPDIAIEAASFRFQNKKAKLSYVDCVGYVLARKNNLLFLTGDKEFENIKNVRFIQ